MFPSSRSSHAPIVCIFQSIRSSHITDVCVFPSSHTHCIPMCVCGLNTKIIKLIWLFQKNILFIKTFSLKCSSVISSHGRKSIHIATSYTMTVWVFYHVITPWICDVMFIKSENFPNFCIININRMLVCNWVFQGQAKVIYQPCFTCIYQY